MPSKTIGMPAMIAIVFPSFDAMAGVTVLPAGLIAVESGGELERALSFAERDRSIDAEVDRQTRVLYARLREREELHLGFGKTMPLIGSFGMKNLTRLSMGLSEYGDENMARGRELK